MGRTFWKTQPDVLAFGVLPAFRRYELYQARYHELVPPMAALSQRLGRRPQVLDIGAGHGEAKRFVDALSGPGEWTAVEIDPKRAEACLSLGYRDVLREVDLERSPLPCGDGSYDAVIASHVLEHLDNAEQALADWYRVLRPGGVLLLGLPMHPGFVAALARFRFRLKGRKPRGHCHFFSLRSLRRFLAAYPVERIWGFRLLSARRQLPLEDWAWFYRVNHWMGARLPWAAGEVNVLIRKPA